MALQDVCVIWLDGTFTGDNYESMTNEFNEKIASSSSSSDIIDNSICNDTKDDLVTNGAPVIIAPTPADAIRHIAKNSGAKIFLISSGRLGRDIVPRIVLEYPHVHSFYIYCFKIAKHIDWALEYDSCLLMFDHQVDLLVRLMRDISAYFIQQGKAHLALDDPSNALKYFNRSWNLETRANQRDKMEPNTKSQEKPRVQPDSRTQLNLLEGDNGLISRAKNASNR